MSRRRKLLDAIAELRADASLKAPPSAALPLIGAKDAAELRQLTVMFMDLVGSTALAERLDPQDLRAAIRAYHKANSRPVGAR